ncbi:hypothetical protein T02_2198 [Trichinella nativa]|uniref:Uncharacterized protein n=1 Tax=Trichinella nativa TaxID=6335 RepID=A0A0V1LKS1_9BILA|nr:hypothetical protein T02_2198 [Trichinella nativa]
MCGQTGPCIQRNWSLEIVAFCGYLLVDLQHAISKNSILAEQRGLQQQAQAIDFLLDIACTT